jgi:hypothetical protein
MSGWDNGYTDSNTGGVRPAISLKSGTVYVSGNGSMANPYVVDAVPSTLSLNESSLRFRGTGGTSTLIATTNAQGTIAWESSNPSVATVDSNGLVTAVSLGTATITARIGLVSASATVKVLTPFEYDSWETIIENVQNSTISDYHVGDTKPITLGNSLGTHTIRIANTSTPSECSTIGFSQTACGFVLEFADIITTYRMNPYDINDTTTIGVNSKGGWEYSDMRAYLNSTTYANESIDYSTTGIYSSLPEVLRNAIINTTVVSGHGSVDTTNYTTTDKLYLLSTHEVWEDDDGNTNAGIDYRDTAYNNTRQLDYYAGLNVTTSSYSGAKKQRNGSNAIWWLRSANSNNMNNFNSVYFYGSWDNLNANITYGVSPAFRIG